jgi:hypothetical protein
MLSEVEPDFNRAVEVCTTDARITSDAGLFLPREADHRVGLTERQRPYRKQRGLANMHYLRYADCFLLLATEGHHPFKQQERNQFRDRRRHPIAHFRWYERGPD